MQRGWRRFRRLPAALQGVIVLAVVGAYTAGVIVVASGGSSTDGKRRLTPLETQVRKLVTNAKLFQRDPTDVTDFRRPRVYSVRCKELSCTVAYAVAVPGLGRIVFQQLEMVRAVFGKADVERLSVKVTRSLPTGPEASPSGEEETAAGLPLLTTVCNRKDLPRNANWTSQKEAQAILSRHCKVGRYNPGAGSQARTGSKQNGSSGDAGQGQSQPAP